MRRLAVVVLIVVLVGAVAAARGPRLAAQHATPTAPAGHPVVGGWAFDTDAADPSNALSYGAFHADGTYVELHPLVGVGIGVWRATGERTADLTIVFQDVDPTPAGVAPGTLIIRVAVEVDPTGNALTAPFTSEGRAPDGTVLFANAFTATATRMAVEPMAPPEPPAVATPAG